MPHCFRLNDWLGACPGTTNVLPDHRRDGFRPDTASGAILGIEPVHERLGTLARIAATTTQRNVLFRDDLRIIDDVLPRWTIAKARRCFPKGDAAVNTGGVSFDDHPLKRSRYVPAIQASFSE